MHERRANTVESTSGYERRCGGFTLLEVLMALAILGLASSSVLFVLNRCMATTADCTLRMAAFELAHENMEKVLASDSVSESVEYGNSEQYPDVTWQTKIEAFSEPMTGQMWVRAVCSADYIDSAGQTQTVELVHWIGALTDQQANELLEDEDLEALASEQLIDTVEEAAEYAGVDAATIDVWIEKGLQVADDGAFIRYNLEIFMQSGGEPADADIQRQVKSIEELAATLNAETVETQAGADVTDTAETER
jgi:prepilin-type N-terminal cleavage/methylation domain-containing protein